MPSLFFMENRTMGILKELGEELRQKQEEKGTPDAGVQIISALFIFAIFGISYLIYLLRIH
jgi:hypothetical protein